MDDNTPVEFRYTWTLGAAVVRTRKAFRAPGATAWEHRHKTPLRGDTRAVLCEGRERALNGTPDGYARRSMTPERLHDARTPVPTERGVCETR